MAARGGDQQMRLMISGTDTWSRFSTVVSCLTFRLIPSVSQSLASSRTRSSLRCHRGLPPAARLSWQCAVARRDTAPSHNGTTTAICLRGRKQARTKLRDWRMPCCGRSDMARRCFTTDGCRDWRTNWRTSRNRAEALIGLQRRNPRFAGVSDAAEWSRTITPRKGHKPLKLARLPVPPQPLGEGDSRCSAGAGLAGWAAACCRGRRLACVRGERYSANKCSNVSACLKRRSHGWTWI